MNYLKYGIVFITIIVVLTIIALNSEDVDNTMPFLIVENSEGELQEIDANLENVLFSFSDTSQRLYGDFKIECSKIHFTVAGTPKTITGNTDNNVATLYQVNMYGLYEDILLERPNPEDDIVTDNNYYVLSSGNYWFSSDEKYWNELQERFVLPLNDLNTKSKDPENYFNMQYKYTNEYYDIYPFVIDFSDITTDPSKFQNIFGMSYTTAISNPAYVLDGVVYVEFVAVPNNGTTDYFPLGEVSTMVYKFNVQYELYKVYLISVEQLV